MKLLFVNTKKSRTIEYNLNLVNLEVEHLAIPNSNCTSVVNIFSSEFTKLCKELQALNESLTITTNRDYVQFSVQSEDNQGSIRIGMSDDVDVQELADVQVTRAVK